MTYLKRGAVWLLLGWRLFDLQMSHAAAETLASAAVTDTVIVHGRAGETDLALPGSTATAVETIMAADIERLPGASVFEILATTTGAYFVESGLKVPTKIVVRGDENHVYMVDGAYLPDFLASRVLELTPLIAVEAIDIVRTSTALTLSPLVGVSRASGAANNGFIAIRTRHAKKPELHLRARAEEYGGARLSGMGGAEFVGDDGRGFYLSGAGEYLTSDGPDGFNLHRNHASVMVKAGIFTDRFALDLKAMHADATFGFQRASQDLQDRRFFLKRRFDPLRVNMVSAQAAMTWTQDHLSELTFAFTQTDGDLIQERFDSARVRVFPNKNEIINGAFRHSFRREGLSIRGGLDYVYWRTPTGQLSYEGFEREERVIGAFLQIEKSLLNDRLTIDAAGRLDQTRIITGIDYFASGRQPTSPAPVSDVDLPAAVFASAGFAVDLGAGWAANGRLAYSTQDARDDIAAIPGATLKGEERRKVELGFARRGDAPVRPSLNFFLIDTKNEASAVDYVENDGVVIALFENRDTIRTGIEAALEGDWRPRGFGSGGFKVGVTQFLDRPDPVGTIWQDQPETVAELHLHHEYGRLGGSLTAKYVSDILSNRFARCETRDGGCRGGAVPPFATIGDYATLDLALSYDFHKAGADLRLMAAVRNLTDQLYETRLGYPNVGRVASVELQARF
ncbi:MAG: TonB-dependent receptor [Pseudomonadota bacterium]